jgi:hypothetical protein
VSEIPSINQSENIDLTALFDTVSSPGLTCDTPGRIGAALYAYFDHCNMTTASVIATNVTGTNAVVTWYTGTNGSGSVLGTGTILSQLGAGTYYARVTADCGSAVEAAVTVPSLTLPVPVITPEGLTSFCEGQSVKLTAPGGALSFDGSGQYLENVTGYPSTNDLTYELWFNAKKFTSDGRQSIINFNGWDYGYVVFQFFQNVLEFSVNGNSFIDQYSDFRFNTNNWYHVAVVYSQSLKNVKFYVNGILTDTKSFTKAIPVSGNLPFTIGAWDKQRYFDGAFDEIRIWNTARTEVEIQSYMNSSVATVAPGLVAYYRMDEASGSTTADSRGSRNLTLINEPAWVSSAPVLANTYAWSTGENTQSIIAGVVAISV